MNTERVKRVVVKIGTNCVLRDNRFNVSLINSLAAEISAMVRDGKEFVLVSSGAIGLGLKRMGLPHGQLSIEMQQALAAIGQSSLMHGYENAFGRHGQTIAQVLLTQENFENAESLRNLHNTLRRLLSMRVVPIINENDAVAVEELAFKRHFSDNDVLAAKVAVHLKADLLVMLSSVGGLFTENPDNNSAAYLVKRVRDLGELGVVVEGKSFFGRGGFESKLKAAEIALKSGIPLIVTKGRSGFLGKIFEGRFEGTLFER